MTTILIIRVDPVIALIIVARFASLKFLEIRTSDPMIYVGKYEIDRNLPQ